MTEQDQGGKNLPAVPDKIIVAPIANDASLLAKAGFTDRLPVAMKDLNNVLGRVLGSTVGVGAEDEPTILSYVLETNTLTPTLRRDVKYKSGPKVFLNVFPHEVVFSPDVKSHSARTTLEITGGKGPDRSIASAFLTDLQDFIHETFPGKRVVLQSVSKEKIEGIEIEGKPILYPIYDEKRKEVDFLSLTEDDLNKLPLVTQTDLEAEEEPYVIIVEGIRGQSSLFLVTALNLIKFHKGEIATEVNLDAPLGEVKFVKQRRVFNLRALSYDNKIFGTSGKDVEALLERFRQLALKNPYFPGVYRL